MPATAIESTISDQDLSAVTDVVKTLSARGVDPAAMITALQALAPAAEPSIFQTAALTAATLSRDELLTLLQRSERLIEIPYTGASGGRGSESTIIGGVEWRHRAQWAHLLIGPDEANRVLARSSKEHSQAIGAFGEVYRCLYDGALGGFASESRDAILVAATARQRDGSIREALGLSFSLPGISGPAVVITEMPVRLAERFQRSVRDGEISVTDLVTTLVGKRFAHDFEINNLFLDQKHGCAMYDTKTPKTIHFPEDLNQ